MASTMSSRRPVTRRHSAGSSPIGRRRGVVDGAAVRRDRADVAAPGPARDLAAGAEGLRGEVPQQPDVAAVVEGGDLGVGGGPGAEAGSVAEQAVGADERVRHVDAAGHHDVVLAVVDAGDEAVVVVAHAPLRAVGARLRRQRVAAGVHRRRRQRPIRA